MQDEGLGQAIVARGLKALKPQGRLFIVANRHLPYEAVLAKVGGKTVQLAGKNGYKVLEAVRI